MGAHVRPQMLVVGAASGHTALADELRQFKAETAGVRIVVLVESYDLKQVFAAFEAGADACLAKSISHEVLLKSLDLVMLGEAVFPATILELVRRRGLKIDGDEAEQQVGESGEAGDGTAPKRLSVRETVILRCLMQGDSNKLIARKFDIAEATVKVHVKAILRKIHAKNRTQAAIWAASHLSANRAALQE
jgi:two-component system nitrate/nitrite response regulator NarL